MIKKNSLLYNTIVFGVGSLGTKAIQFLLIPLLTAFMNPTEFGQIDYYNSLVMLLVPIVSLSMADGIVRFGIQQNSQDKKKIISSTFSILVIFSVSLAFLALILSYYGRTLYATLLLFLITQIINQNVLSFLKVLELNLIYALSGFLSAMLQIITLVVVFQQYSHSLEVYFLTCSAALIFVNLLLLTIIKPSTGKINYVLILNILKYSAPLIPNVLLWWIMNFSDRFFIKNFLGFTSAGYYSLATKFPILINTVMLIFLQAWQLELFKIKDRKKLNKMINTASAFFNYVNYLLLAILVPIIPLVLSLLANSSYSLAKEFVPLLLMGGIYSNLSMFIGTNYLVSKDTNKLWMTAIVGAVLNLVLNVILIPVLGINGASLATLISYGAVYIARYVDQKEKFNLQLNWTKIFIINIVVICQIMSFFFLKGMLVAVSVVTIVVILAICIQSIYELKNIRENVKDEEVN